MSPLTRKLLRDLRGLAGQVLSIAVVVACAVAGWTAARGTWAALLRARDTSYAEHRLADVFASVERAPDAVVARIAELPGVRAAYGRIVEPVLVPMEAMDEPVQGIVVSVPARGEPPFHTLYLRRGRHPDPARGEEALVSEGFALAHGLGPGSKLGVVLGGVRHELRVVGVALSPELVFASAPGQMAFDDKRFVVIWMTRPALAAAARMEGAWNDLALGLEPGASREAVIQAVDRVLGPYGCASVYGRDKHPSAVRVDAELSQLRALALFAPLVFLGVAAFLLHLVLTRLFELQRTEIAVLRALGYGRWEVAVHHLGFVAAVVGIGAVAGGPLGALVGHGWTGLYRPYFRFPELAFTFEPGTFLTAVLVAFASAALGTSRALAAVGRLSPAAAMLPAAPPRYRRGGLGDGFGLTTLVGPSARMVLREILRRPVRTGLSALGVGASIGVIVVGLFSRDAIRHYLDDQFHTSYREAMTVSFRRAVPLTDLSVLAAMPGVTRVEPQRAVPVRVLADARSRDVVLLGHAGGRLHRVVEWPSRVVPIPEDGVVLTKVLAERLSLRVGDEVRLEILAGARREIRVPLRGVADEPAGLFVHADVRSIARWLGEPPSATHALLDVDPLGEPGLVRALRKVPALASIAKTRWVLDQFESQTAGSMLVFTGILTAFGAAIAIAVVYNNARIALSTRARELATLRVLGMTRGEISGILLGGLAVEVALGVPLGVLWGGAFARGIASTIDPEEFRLAPYVATETYAFAVAVVVVAAVLSALVVRRKLDHLDLVAVLKTKD